MHNWSKSRDKTITYLVSSDRKREGGVLRQVTGVHRVDIGHEQEREPYHNDKKSH